MEHSIKKLDGLTATQLRMLNVIKDFIKTNGFSPSYRELSDLMYFRSYSNVYRYVKILYEAGYIEYDPHKARSISVVIHECPNCGHDFGGSDD